jgi:phage tail-like protein
MPGNGNSATMAQAYANCRFYVQIDGITQAVFTEIGAMSFELDVVTAIEGGVPTEKHPGPLKLAGNLVLKRGMTKSNELFKWFREFAYAGKFEYKHVSVLMYDSDGTEIYRLNLMKAFPVKWSGAQYSSEGKMAAIETLEIAYNEWNLG